MYAIAFVLLSQLVPFIYMYFRMINFSFMMNKQSILILALIVSVTIARGQSSATTIEYKKNSEPALVIQLPNTIANVEAMILEKLKQAGYTPSSTGHLFWKSNKKDGF